MRALFLFMIIIISDLVATCLGQEELPNALDLRALYPSCRAWQPYDEGATGCATCCPSAVAAVLSAHDCMHDSRDSRYNAAQIWDCAADPATTLCSEGTDPDKLLENLGNGGAYARVALIPEACGSLTVSEPSGEICAQRFTACAKRVPGLMQNGQAQAMRGATSAAFASIGVDWRADNTRRLMVELLHTGPAISLLAFSTDDGRRFLAWRNTDAVFMPLAQASSTIISFRHCIMVTGWGTLGTTPFFWVQNSYGTVWGRGGMGKLLRGADFVESAWRSIVPRSRPCVYSSTIDEPCPNRTSQVTWTTTPAPFREDPAALSAVLLLTMEEEGGGLSNAAILGVAFASAAVVAALLFLSSLHPVARFTR